MILLSALLITSLTHQSLGELRLRELEEGDIAVVVQYWTQAHPDYYRDIGVDPEKIPTPKVLREIFKSRLQEGSNEWSYVAVSGSGEVLAVFNLVANPSEAGLADAHFHILKEENRQVGLGTLILKKFIRLGFQEKSLKRIVFEPITKNLGMIKLLQKIGGKTQSEKSVCAQAILLANPVLPISFDSISF